MKVKSLPFEKRESLLTTGKTDKKIESFLQDIKHDFCKNRMLYLLVLPVVIWYVAFCYIPMYGIILAFKDFNLNINNSFFQNIMQSEWIGFTHFQNMFSSFYFERVFKNTLIISITSLIFTFPMPIILALLLNELRNQTLKRTAQTIGYMPHFISTVVICGIIKDFTSDSGIVSVLLSKFLGTEPVTMLNNPNLFLPVYVISGIWQGVGWSSIMYIAALSGIDQSLYSAAVIDGAGKWKQAMYITIPGILPTIIIMLILQVGQLLNVSFEKILLLYNELTWSTADVITTFSYRRGLLNRDWSYSVAVGMFNSIINFILLIITNHICRRTTEHSLW